MRNLKRALSLALASVMLLGMMVVGTSAASYPDVDDKDHVEAIEVLSAVGVIVGDNGNFRPDDNVSRNEMAVIMAKLILGTYEADSYVGSHPFTDVPDWASKYVAACYNSGIIAGRGEGIYDGSSTVTAVEAAAMMLRALGYEDLSKGYQQWDQPVAAKANEISLFEGLSGAGNAAMDRDSVAQLALNTLKATMVTTVRTGQDITLPDGTTIASTRSYEMRSTSYGWKDAIDDEGTANGGYIQLGEYLYKGDLKLNKDRKDDFGRPCSTWEYKKDDVASAVDAADMVYVGEVKSKDIYSDLNLRTGFTQGTHFDIFVDSDTALGGTTKKIEKNGDNAANTYGADGQVVEVWYTKGDNADDDEIVMVITSSYLGVVVDETYKQDGKDGMRVDVLGMGLKFIEAQGYKEDDLLLVNMSGSDLKAIVGAPETVTGEATRVATDYSSVTIDGKKYSKAVQFSIGDNDVIKGKAHNSLGIEKSYTLYLDQNGCYLAAVEVEDNSKTNLVYVTRIYDGSTMDGDEVVHKAMATVVYMDGTYKTVALTKCDGTNAVAGNYSTYDGAHAGKLAELIYDEDDKEYELKAVNAGDWKNFDFDVSSDVELKTDTRYTKLNNAAGNVYLNSDTVYVFVTYKDNNLGVPTVSEGIDEVKVVTGGVDFDIDRTGGDAMSGAYAKKTSDRSAGYVVIASAYEASAKDVVYLKNDPKDTIKDGKTYEGWFATSTEKEKINIDDGSTGTISGDGFYEYSEKSNGNLKLTAVPADPAKDAAGAFLDKAITSMQSDSQGYLMTISGGNTTYDLNDVKVNDMTDAKKESENAYGSNVTSLSALYRVVDGGRYVVNVSIYVNTDNEVTNLVIDSIEAKHGAIAAVYDSAAVTKATLTATNEVSIGGVDVAVTESSDIDTVVSGLSSLSTWTITKTNGNKDLQFEAKTAGALGSGGAPTTAQAANMTQVTEGKNAVKAVSSTAKLAGASSTVGTSAGTYAVSIAGKSYDVADTNSDIPTQVAAWIVKYNADAGNAGFTAVAVGTDGVKFEAKTAGSADTLSLVSPTGDWAKDSEGQDMKGADAVKAVYKVTDIAGKIADAVAGTGTLTIGGHTATVTTNTLAEQLAEFVADYTANASAKADWTATVQGADKIRFTAKTAGALTTTGATQPAGTTLVTAGADAN